MPLILMEEDFAAWLDLTTSPQAVDALLRPYAAAEMESYPVSMAVNNLRNETAECVERVEVGVAVESQLTLGLLDFEGQP